MILNLFSYNLTINSESEESTPLYESDDYITFLLEIYTMTYIEKARNVIYAWLILPLVALYGALTLI